MNIKQTFLNDNTCRIIVTSCNDNEGNYAYSYTDDHGYTTVTTY